MLNHNVEVRDALLFQDLYRPEKYSCGTREFSLVDVNTLLVLTEGGFLDLSDRQNEVAPSIGEIIDFMKKHKGFYVAGYAVSPNRDDYRISIDTIFKHKKIFKYDIRDFNRLFGDADVYSCKNNFLYAWYD